jgi:hypothetical protein
LSDTALQFFLDMVNSAIGAFLGFLLALYLQRLTDRHSKKEKIGLVLSNIKEELSDISSAVQQYIDIDKPLKCNIQTPSWDAVQGSGIILELIGEPSYIHIIKVYSLIKNFNTELPLLDDNGILRYMRDIIGDSSIIIQHPSR